MKTLRLLAMSAFTILATHDALAQTPGPPQAPAPAPEATPAPTHPFATELRKTVGQITVAFKKGETFGTASGTCFFVFYPDDRLGKGRGFGYLVTNRHVAQPGIEEGNPYQLVGATVRANRKGLAGGSDMIPIPFGPIVHWYFPTDDAADLAVLPFIPPDDKYDIESLPIAMFATRDEVERARIVEGTPILFTGFFYQFPGMKKFQPIVREGVVAMMPDEMIETTLHKPGYIYLADVHVFEGNSGSPLIVDEGGLRNGQLYVGYAYRLLGVISGFYHEDASLTLTIATSYRGTIQENSGIASVVPVDALKDLLERPDMQALRNMLIATTPPPQ